MPAQIHQRDLIGLLRYEAGRRPEIAALCDRAVDLTDAEIAEAHVPLPWYRKALAELRGREITARRMAQADRTIDAFIVRGEVGDIVGIIAEYVGSGAFTEGDRGLQVSSGDLLFFPDHTDDFWFDAAHVARGASRFLHETRPISKTTRSEYMRLRRERLNRTHPDAPTIDMTGAASVGGPPSPLAAIGVRFSRV